MQFVTFRRSTGLRGETNDRATQGYGRDIRDRAGCSDADVGGSNTELGLRGTGEGTVTFVSVPDAARHGIETANAHAGQTFNRKFGEVCTIVQV